MCLNYLGNRTINLDIEYTNSMDANLYCVFYLRDGRGWVSALFHSLQAGEIPIQRQHIPEDNPLDQRGVRRSPWTSILVL